MNGAICFIVGSITSLFQAIDDSKALYSGLTLTPYLIGGIFFFIGTASMFIESFQEVHRKHKIRAEIIRSLEEDLKRRRAFQDKFRKTFNFVFGEHHIYDDKVDDSVDIENNEVEENTKKRRKSIVKFVNAPRHVGIRRRIIKRRRQRSGSNDNGNSADDIEYEMLDEEEDERLQHLGRKEQIKLQHLGYFW